MTRLTADHRRAQIFHAARTLSCAGNLYVWTLDDVAEFVKMTVPGVRYYFYSVSGLRAEIITGAIDGRDLDIIGQAVAAHDPLVSDIAPALRDKAVQFLATKG